MCCCCTCWEDVVVRELQSGLRAHGGRWHCAPRCRRGAARAGGSAVTRARLSRNQSSTGSRSSSGCNSTRKRRLSDSRRIAARSTCASTPSCKRRVRASPAQPLPAEDDDAEEELFSPVAATTRPVFEEPSDASDVIDSTRGPNSARCSLSSIQIVAIQMQRVHNVTKYILAFLYALL